MRGLSVQEVITAPPNFLVGENLLFMIARSMRRTLTLAFQWLACLAAFVATCVAVRRLAPMDVAEVTPKLQFFAQHKDEFDTIFIGSSRIYHGLSPRTFDATMLAEGRATKSFNFGIDGMMSPETLMMARRLVAMHPARLQRVLLEISNLRALNPENVTTRDAYWHNSDALAFAMRKFFRQCRDSGQRKKEAWEEFAAHGRLFAMNEANLGRGQEMLPISHEKPARISAAQPLGDHLDGFMPVASAMAEKPRARFLAAMQELASGTVRQHRWNAAHRDALARLHVELTAKRIELILVVTPTTTRDYGARLDAPADIPLLAFDNPTDYPDLFREEARWDFDHLNARGAEEFSRLLGRRCAGLPNAKP